MFFTGQLRQPVGPVEETSACEKFRNKKSANMSPKVANSCEK
jgi:hypothetical protein